MVKLRFVREEIRVRALATGAAQDAMPPDMALSETHCLRSLKTGRAASGPTGRLDLDYECQRRSGQERRAN